MYEIVQIVADRLGIDLQAGEEAGNPPDDADLDAVRSEADLWLTTLFSLSPAFEEMRQDPLKIVANRRDSQYSLLLKPVGLQAFFGAVAVAMDKTCGKLDDLDLVIGRLLELDWSISSTFWKGIMVNARGNITNKKNDLQLASDLAAWMITGNNSTTQFQQSLAERYRRQIGRNDAKLPDPEDYK